MLVSAWSRRTGVAASLAVVGACAPPAVPARVESGPPPMPMVAEPPVSVVDGAPAGTIAPLAQSWEDSVFASLTLREKAAQMVWQTTFGDYVSDDAPQWRRLKANITDDRVGGVLISVGSPLEIAAKLNALQQISRVPLLVGADLEAGPGFRARGGVFLPNNIDLGGAPVFPPQMALGAAADTGLAYEQGRVTAVESRALGIPIAFSPVLDVNNNPANP